jgi:hypothetical protein
MLTSNPVLPHSLQLQFAHLKRDPRQLAIVTSEMRTVEGVVAVEESPRTGGILIHYAAAAASCRQFWNGVECILLAHHLEHDLMEGQPAPGRSQGWRGALESFSAALNSRR